MVAIAERVLAGLEP